MKRLILSLTTLIALSASTSSLATIILFDLRDPFIESIDEVNSFDITQGGITATLTALPQIFDGRDLLLNQTSSSFGVNVDGTTCGSSEKSAEIDDGCTEESVQVVFDKDVLLNNLTVSSFGSSDNARVDISGASSIDISNTGATSLNNTFLSAGSSFTLLWVSGNGFSFDNFSVVPAPTPLALIALGLLGLVTSRKTHASQSRKFLPA